MKKKILYGIIFISIFLLSTLSSVTPVQGYEFGIPNEGIGVTSEGEIKLYDEDEWEDHLGKDSDANDLFAGDSDVVGAKSKSTILEFEKDEEIKYIKDHSWDGSIEDGSITAVTTVTSLYDPSVTSAYAPLMFFYNASTWFSMDPTSLGLVGETFKLTGAGNLSVMYELATNINASVLTPVYGVVANTLTPHTAAAGYNKKFDGTYLIRDYWETTEDPFDADPDDEDDEVPYLADPRDLKDAWDIMEAFRVTQVSDLLTLQGIWGSNWQVAGGVNPTGTMFAHGKGGGPVPAGLMNASDIEVYEYLNTTIIPAFIELYLVGGGIITGAQADAIMTAIEVPNNITALQESYYFGGMVANDGDYLIDRVYGLWGASMQILAGISDAIVFAYPSKPGFFLQTIVAGQPFYVPEADFVARMVDEFNINDEILYKVPYVSQEYTVAGSTVYKPVYAYWDVSAEAGTVTFEIEYLDGQLDPEDSIVALGGELDKELKDFELVFLYGQYGSQENVHLKDGDEIFWQSGGVDQIPGFEVSVLLGASAISIIALIFVVMKKRKR